MKSNKEFVADIAKGNEALFKASQLNVADYFNDMPNQEALVEHFDGRMVNERMNMVEISNSIASMPADFRLVKEVIEHITGEECDVAGAIAKEEAKPTAKGASLLAKYDAESDPAALAAYQLVAEGRAEAVWNTMADVIEDEFISTRYAKIAKDEGFHSTIGAMKLETLVGDAETQARVEALVSEMRKDLYEISCKNTTHNAEGQKLVSEAYGW